METIVQFFRRRPDYRTGTLLAGSLFWLVGFFLLPLTYLLAVSFARRSPYGSIDWTLGLANYARAFHPLYLEVYWRSFWMGLVTTALCALLGFPVAYTLALRVSARWKSALLMLVVIPFWTSFLIRTYAWMIILRSEGVVNNTLLALHLIHEPLHLLYTPLAVMIGLVYGELPFMILPLYGVLQKLDPTLLEAAADLGAPWWPAFVRVTLPLSAPGLVAGSILVFIASVGAFVTPDLLGGARTMMVGNLIQDQFAVARDQPFGSAVAFLLTFVVLALVAAGLRKSEHTTRGDILMAGARRVGPSPEGHSVLQWLKGFRPQGGFGLFLTTTAVYLFLYAPIFVLVVCSFNRSRLSAHWMGFTGEWYAILWRDEQIFQSLQNSLLVAAGVTLACVVFGTMSALIFARPRLRGKALLNGVVYLPLVIPEIVVAVATVIFFSLLTLKLSLWTIVIAHITFCISYVIIVVGVRLAGMDRSLQEAALDLGANEWTTFFRVTLPIAAPAILAAALLVFTTSFDDYLITSFVAGVRSTTLPLEIYSRLKRGITPEINAISTIILIATIPLVFVAQRLERGSMKLRTALASAGAVFLLMVMPVVARTWQAGAQLPQLNIYTWSSYISPRVIHGFEREYHCRVNYDLYDSNEALLTKLQAGNADYDIVVPTDYMVEILVRQGLLARLEKQRLPNVWANTDPRFLGLPFDPHNEYSAPYCWGTSGLAYRADLVKGNIDSWNALFDPRWAGHILLLDDTREVIGMALKKLGYSLNSTDPGQIRQARDLLLRQKPLVKGFNSSNFELDLAAGDAWIAQAYNGNMTFVMRDEPRIRYVIPKEGCTISVDSTCIPRHAPHPQLAEDFINYFHRPEVSALFVNDCGYNTPSRSDRKGIDPWLLSNPAVFPDPAALDRCEFMRDLGPVIAQYDQSWTEIKAR